MVVACMKVEHLKGDIELPPQIKNNKYIVTYPNDNNLCWWVALYCGINSIKTKINDPIISQVKKMLLDYYNIDTKPTKFI